MYYKNLLNTMKFQISKIELKIRNQIEVLTNHWNKWICQLYTYHMNIYIIINEIILQQLLIFYLLFIKKIINMR